MHSIYSKLLRKEEISNKDRQFGSADFYYPLWVVERDGSYSFALFTTRELENAIERGRKNPANLVPPQPVFKRIWHYTLKLLKLR